jgi:hypothetical protein
VLSRCRATLASLLLAAALLLPADRLSSSALSVGQASSARAQASRPATDGPLIIENAGQWPEAARFQVWGGGPTLWLAEDALWLTVVAGSQVDTLERSNVSTLARSHVGTSERDNVQRVNVRLSFPGANSHARLEPFDRRDTHVSYFLGSDPAGWRPDVSVWGGVRYVDLYPGIDLVVGAGLAPDLAAPELDGGRPQDGRPQESPLPWRLEAREGADLAAVRLRVEGVDAVALASEVLRLGTAAGEVSVPLLAVDGLQVRGSQAEGSNVEPLGVQTFDVTAPFSRSPTLALSPSPTHPFAVAPQDVRDLVYGTFLGGSRDDCGVSIAVDGVGSAYVTGRTESSDFPTTPGVFDTSYNGGDVFVAKLNGAGSGLAYATFLGGSGYNYGGIAVDGAGSAYVTGETSSRDFPTTPGAFDTSFNGGDRDAFVVKLYPTGSGLAYSTFLGGRSKDIGRGIAVDGAGSAYVTGWTWSSDLPTTPGAFDTSFNTDYDAFVVKLNPAGSGLAYSTFLGSSQEDRGHGIAVDRTGSAYVTGETWSGNFPTTPGAFDTRFNGVYGADAFVAKLNPAGSGLAYATFLGGSDWDEGQAIAVDGAGSAYVTGWAESRDFPTTPGAFDASYNGGGDAFVAKLNRAGSGLAYTTFLGGSDLDAGYGIAVDGVGSAYVTGFTWSPNFPTTPGAFDTSYNGGFDAFVAKLNGTGGGLAHATFLGGSDEGRAIAVDGVGNAYVTGDTSSSDFPITPDAFDTSYNGGFDAFVAQLWVGPPPPPAIQGTIWHDLDGDGVRDAGESGLAGVQVCAEPLGRQPIRCAISGPDGSYTIELDSPGTYLVAPTAAPAGMRLTTPGFRLPVVVREGDQVWDIDFGYR